MSNAAGFILDLRERSLQACTLRPGQRWLLTSIMGLCVTLASGYSVEAVEQPQVRLLFPVMTGLELEQLVDLVPQATLLEIDEQNYVLVGRFGDARVAHRLGRSLQKRVGIPFDLAYDPGHPQLNLAWLRDEPVELARSGSSRTSSPIPSPGEQRSGPTDVQLLRIVEASTVRGPGQAEAIAGGASVWGVLSYPPARATGAAALKDPSGGPITRAAAQPETPTDSQQPLPVTAKLEASVPPESVVAADAGVHLATGTSALQKPQPRQQSTAPLSQVSDAMGDRPIRQVTANVFSPMASAPTPSMRPAGGGMRQALWESAPKRQRRSAISVALARAEQPEAPALTRLSPAANPELDYLFVRVADTQQLEELKRLAPVTELTLHQGRTLARVGVFTRSLRGQLLLEQRLEQLRQHRLALLVVRGGASQLAT